MVDMAIYTLRNMVERCFNKLKNSRHLATCYDKTEPRRVSRQLYSGWLYFPGVGAVRNHAVEHAGPVFISSTVA